MHQENGANILTLNAEASTDLSANTQIGRGIGLDANGDAALLGAGASGLDAAGILVDGGIVAGDPVTIVALGSALCLAGAAGAANEGDYMTSDAAAGIVPVGAGNVIVFVQAFQAVANNDLFWGLAMRFQSSDGAP